MLLGSRKRLNHTLPKSQFLRCVTSAQTAPPASLKNRQQIAVIVGAYAQPGLALHIARSAADHAPADEGPTFLVRTDAACRDQRLGIACFHPSTLLTFCF